MIMPLSRGLHSLLLLVETDNVGFLINTMTRHCISGQEWYRLICVIAPGAKVSSSGLITDWYSVYYSRSNLLSLRHVIGLSLSKHLMCSSYKLAPVVV